MNSCFNNMFIAIKPRGVYYAWDKRDNYRDLIRNKVWSLERFNAADFVTLHPDRFL